MWHDIWNFHRTAQMNFSNLPSLSKFSSSLENLFSKKFHFSPDRITDKFNCNKSQSKEKQFDTQKEVLTALIQQLLTTREQYCSSGFLKQAWLLYQRSPLAAMLFFTIYLILYCGASLLVVVNVLNI
jgi:hypothetical protein